MGEGCYSIALHSSDNPIADADASLRDSTARASARSPNEEVKHLAAQGRTMGVEPRGVLHLEER